MMTILALDQSTKRTGWSSWVDGNLDKHGLLEVRSQNEKNPFTRMIEMHGLIKNLINEIRPVFVVIEDVQYQKSYAVYGQLSQMQGVIVSLLAELDIGFEIIPATKWKSFCKIKGKKRDEQKANTILMVKETYGIDVGEDTADAIGLGRYFSKA